MTSLCIIKQNSLAQEKYSKNGVQKIVHVVVKNTSFVIHLGLGGTHRPDFHHMIIEATLLYDCEDMRFVDFVKLSPIEYKTYTKETGEQCTIEMRIKVLTSQLEDMFFRIKFMAYDAVTKMLIPNLVTITEPIKVISKPDQLKKKPNKSKKRTVSDIFVDTLFNIESQQNEQQTLLERLQMIVERIPNNISEKLNDNNTIDTKPSLEDLQKITLVGQDRIQDDFEKEFAILLASYMIISANNRSGKIKKVILNMSPRETEQLTELLDLLWTEGLQRELRRDLRSASLLKPCNPADCSWKKELEKIEEFYREFLSSSYLNINVGPPSFIGY